MWEEGTSGSKKLQFLILVAPRAQTVSVFRGTIHWSRTQPHAESMHFLNELVLTCTLHAPGFACSGWAPSARLPCCRCSTPKSYFLPDPLRWLGHPSEIIWGSKTSPPGRSESSFGVGDAPPSLSSLRCAPPALDYALGSPYVFMITPPYKLILLYIKFTQLKLGIFFCLLIGP